MSVKFVAGYSFHFLGMCKYIKDKTLRSQVSLDKVTGG